MFELLKCPCCGNGMHMRDNSLLCNAPKSHCYDRASEGYIHMLPTHSAGGDSLAAVRSRTAFLDTDAYLPIAKAICELLHKHIRQGSVVVDAGCGEGYYSCRIAKSGFSVIGLDLSKSGIRAAAKRAKRETCENTLFLVGNLFSMPLLDASADALVNIFAPCVESEFLRILKPEGFLTVVYAGPKHLMGMKRAIYKEVYENEVRADMPAHMTLVDQASVTYTISLSGNESIQNLFAMTPYYWRTGMADREKLLHLDALETEIDIGIDLYQKL